MEKRKLIMLPGWGMDSSVWEPAKAFLFEYIEVILCEWHGINTVDGFKTKVFSMIEEEVEGRFCLLGWSLGSLLAIEAACKYNDRVERIILVSGTGCFTRDKKTNYSFGWPQSVVEKMKVALNNDRDKTLKFFYVSMFTKEEVKQGSDKKFIEIIKMGKTYKTIELEAGLDFLIQEDARDILGGVNVPLLLIHGEKDTICPVQASEYISSQVKGEVFLNVIANVGHVPFHTATNEFNTIIKAFMEQGEEE